MVKKVLFVLLLLALPFSFAYAVPGQTPQEKAAQKTTVTNLIGTLNDAEAVDGCSCYLESRQNAKNSNAIRFIFSAELDEKEAYIKLDGKKIKLKLVSKVDYKGKPRVGKKSSRKYVAGGVIVVVEYVVTSVCDPQDESCEFTGHSGTLTVIKDSRIQKMTKLTGGCGC